MTREYGFAIPAGITGGIGTMVYLVTSGSIDPSSVTTVVFLSMAGGFAAIWPLGLAALPRTTHPVAARPGDRPRPDRLWRFAARQPMALDWIQAGVALFLVVAGTAMVLRRNGPLIPLRSHKESFVMHFAPSRDRPAPGQAGGLGRSGSATVGPAAPASVRSNPARQAHGRSRTANEPPVTRPRGS